MRRNSLAIVFFVLFVLAVGGDAVAGWKAFNADALEHHEATMSLARYLVSSDYGNAVLENWQSEFLQFTLYVVLTVWLVQKGSTESKAPGREGLGSDRDQRVGADAGPDSPLWARTGGWRTAVYSNSLLIVMFVIFVASWFGQSVTGWSAYNDQQTAHHAAEIGWRQYVGSADFWEATLQNWQSEFLAVGAFVVFSIYLRQRGSPESKPVGAPHSETATEG